MRWIPKENGKIGENAPTDKIVLNNIDCFCEMLKMRDEDIVEPPHVKHWDGEQTSFKDPDGIFLEVVQSIGKNISM